VVLFNALLMLPLIRYQTANKITFSLQANQNYIFSFFQGSVIFSVDTSQSLTIKRP